MSRCVGLLGKVLISGLCLRGGMSPVPVVTTAITKRILCLYYVTKVSEWLVFRTIVGLVKEKSEKVSAELSNI